jgi:hypothetical protein
MNHWLAKAILEESSLKKSELKKSEQHFTYLIKSSDDDQYRKFAHKGMALMHPVSINGRKSNPNNGVGYHSTIKAFNTEKDTASKAHEIASQNSFPPPNPKETGIKPIKLQGQGGYTVHALELTGPPVDNLKDQNSKFKSMGFQNNYDFKPHISVDKETWDDISAKGHKTAADAGISFGNAELRQGQNFLNRYPNKQPMTMQQAREQQNHFRRKKVA